MKRFKQEISWYRSSIFRFQLYKSSGEEQKEIEKKRTLLWKVTMIYERVCFGNRVRRASLLEKALYF